MTLRFFWVRLFFFFYFVLIFVHINIASMPACPSEKEMKHMDVVLYFIIFTYIPPRKTGVVYLAVAWLVVK